MSLPWLMPTGQPLITGASLRNSTNSKVIVFAGPASPDPLLPSKAWAVMLYCPKTKVLPLKSPPPSPNRAYGATFSVRLSVIGPLILNWTLPVGSGLVTA